MLLAGNRRFAARVPEHPNQDAARRGRLAAGAGAVRGAVRLFRFPAGRRDHLRPGPGDLFVVRTAGHVLGPEVLGSIEYGVSVLGSPLVVVLGHDACGAVAAARAAVDNGDTAQGYVRDVIEKVTPSVLASRAARHHEDGEFIAAHIRHTTGAAARPLPAAGRRGRAGESRWPSCPTGWPTAAPTRSPPAVWAPSPGRADDQRPRGLPRRMQRRGCASLPATLEVRCTCRGLFVYLRLTSRVPGPVLRRVLGRL